LLTTLIVRDGLLAGRAAVELQARLDLAFGQAAEQVRLVIIELVEVGVDGL
jgi:hypothetical protein